MTNSSLVERLTTRETLRLCTAGSVDDGKSTFVGRLLYDTKSVLADQVESMERSSADRGFDGMDLSLLVDGLRADVEEENRERRVVRRRVGRGGGGAML